MSEENRVLLIGRVEDQSGTLEKLNFINIGIRIPPNNE